MMGPNYHRPSSLSQLIPLAWPLQRWGMDLVGPLPMAQGNLKYAVVAVEYFTKWIEAKPLVNITSVCMKILLAKHHLQIWSPQGTNCG